MEFKWIYCGNKDGVEYFTCVDADDYEKLKEEIVHIDNNGYPMLTKKNNGKTITTRIHRIVIGNLSENCFIQHVNGVFLDNRKINLKIRRKTEMVSVRASSQGYTKTPEGKYIVRLKIQNHVKYIGTFQTEKEARAAFAGACIASGVELIQESDKPPLVSPTELERQEALIIRLNRVCENIRERARKSNMSRAIKIQSPDGTIYPSVKYAKEKTTLSSGTILKWAKANKNGWSVVKSNQLD